MAATKSRRRSLGENMEPTTCAPLGHPLRVRVLEITNERDISPSAFVSEELWQAGISFDDCRTSAITSGR